MTVTLKRLAPEMFSRAVERLQTHEVGAKKVLMDYKLRNRDKNPIFTIEVTEDQFMFEDQDSYLDLNDYLYAGYSYWIYPLYHQLCKRGDVIDLQATVSRQGMFEGFVNLTIGVSIPDNLKSQWAPYLNKYYKDLGKISSFVQGIDFSIQNFNVNQIFSD